MSHRWMKALPISYSLFSGMIGTQSVLFSKALSTLLRTTIDGHSQLGTWFFWLVLLLFLCCAYFWVTSLNKVGLSIVAPTAMRIMCCLCCALCCQFLWHTHASCAASGCAFRLLLHYSLAPESIFMLLLGLI
jgi:glucan phosphoethanolaminetransferase (alkaline phosphatase superfamily)